MLMDCSQIRTEVRIRRSSSEAALAPWMKSDIGQKARLVSNLLEKFIRPQSGFASEPTPIESSSRFRRMENLFCLLPEYKASDWYRSLKNEIESNGFASYKHFVFHDLQSLDGFFENYMLPLFNSIQDNGYEQSISPDVPRGIIWSDGAMAKSVHGNHRFVIAQLLGVREIPIELDAIHRDWWDSKIGGRLTPETLLKVGNRYSKQVTLKRR